MKVTVTYGTYILQTITVKVWRNCLAVLELFSLPYNIHAFDGFADHNVLHIEPQWLSCPSLQGLTRPDFEFVFPNI